jgi:hypothetical protein
MNNSQLLTKSESIQVNEKEEKVNFKIPILSSGSLCVQKDQSSFTSVQPVCRAYHELNSPTSNMFKPVSSTPAPIDNLLVNDPENQASNLQTYSYQNTDWPLQQPVGFKRTTEFISE